MQARHLPANLQAFFARVGPLLLPLLLAACTEPPPGDPGLSLTVAVSPTPATVGAGRIVIALAAREGSPVDGAM